MSNALLWAPVALYLTGWLVEFGRYWQHRTPLPLWGAGLLALGWGAHTVFLASRILESALSLSNMLNAVAWVSMVLYYLVHRRYRHSVFGFVFPPFSAALLLSTVLTEGGAVDLASGLPGGVAYPQVLSVHIAAVLAGHLLFALACAVGIGYLYGEYRLKAKRIDVARRGLPSLGSLERLNHKAIALGFFFLSVGILVGMLAASMKGQPAPVFSWRQFVPSLTWLVYAVFLLEYALQGRRGRFGAVWSIVGFLIVVTSLVIELHFLLTRA